MLAGSAAQSCITNAILIRVLANRSPKRCHIECCASFIAYVALGKLHGYTSTQTEPDG